MVNRAFYRRLPQADTPALLSDPYPYDFTDRYVVLSSYLEVVGIEYVVLPTTFSSMIHRSLFGRGVDFQLS